MKALSTAIAAISGLTAGTAFCGGSTSLRHNSPRDGAMLCAQRELGLGIRPWRSHNVLPIPIRRINPAGRMGRLVGAINRRRIRRHERGGLSRANGANAGNAGQLAGTRTCSPRSNRAYVREGNRGDLGRGCGGVKGDMQATASQQRTNSSNYL